METECSYFILRGYREKTKLRNVTPLAAPMIVDRISNVSEEYIAFILNK
jgi:hypothetical protein